MCRECVCVCRESVCVCVERVCVCSVCVCVCVFSLPTLGEALGKASYNVFP